jgi:hypothetical protein
MKKQADEDILQLWYFYLKFSLSMPKQFQLFPGKGLL